MPNEAAAAEPQDVPVEASEVLAFTPPSLIEIAGAPSFVLRVATGREKRVRKRLMKEEGAVMYSTERIRAETLRGLKSLWTPESYDEHAPILEAYWHAHDDYQSQLKDDPELKWEWDADEERAIQQLWNDVSQSHRPLAKMNAANAEFGELAVITTVAVMVERISNLDVKVGRDRGMLTVDCAYDIQDALAKLEDKHGLKTGKAWGELSLKSMRRMFLDEDEAKNSASPLPSTSPQQSSKETADAPGQSKVSEPSKQPTPESE
jgi:hypothetical protein